MTHNARDLAIHLTEPDAISERDLLVACLKYMSTDEVADMLDINELLTPLMGTEGLTQARLAVRELKHSKTDDA